MSSKKTNIKKLKDKALLYDLDQLGIDNRERDAVELVDKRAEVITLRTWAEKEQKRVGECLTEIEKSYLERDNLKRQLKEARQQAKDWKERFNVQVNITFGYVERLHKEERKIKDALSMAARRWSEWGDRAMSVWEILDPEGE